ncbi:hypothetical protein ACKKBG_A00375 [Auxenochlorella protothecoides x Auxenochlorella symbiontica]
MSAAGPVTTAIALDTEFANRKIWLVKVPNFVAERWRAVCQTNAHDCGDPVGPELGQILVDKPAAGAKEASMHLSLTHSDTEGLPKTFLMNVATQNMASMAAFAQTGPCSVSAVGRVFQKFDVVVERGAAGASTSGADGVIDPEYRQLSRMRAKAAATKSRTTQLISQPQFTNLRHPMHIGTTKKRDPTEKRLAKPAEELTADLFRLFERQPHWIFAQLQRQTEQPTQHLKAVLLEIAVQNKRGPYKDMWELKKGYRLTGDA